MSYPLVPLREVLTHYREYIDAPDPRTYPKLSVKLYGRGVTLDTPADGATLKMKRHQLAKAGQVILSEIWGKKGAIGLVPREGEGALCTSHFFLFDIHHDRVEPDYLALIFQANYLEEQLGTEAFGTTGYAAVRPKNLLAATIPLPPLAEQRRIVARVEAVAARVEEARRLREESAAEVATLEVNSVSRLLANNSGSANQLRLQDAIKSHDSGWSPQCGDEPAEPGEWGVLKTTCVQWEGFDPRQNKKLLARDAPRDELQVAVGDVLITRAGPVNRVGVACAVLTPAPKLMLSDKIIRLRPCSEVIPRYLALALGSAEAQEYFRHGKTGLAESQVNISRERLLALPVCIPPLSDQRRIVTHLDALQAKAIALRALQSETAAELDALLPALLAKAFAGEL